LKDIEELRKMIGFIIVIVNTFVEPINRKNTIKKTKEKMVNKN
jgi:hypothetical protein